MRLLIEKKTSDQYHGVCFAVVMTILNLTALLPAGAQTVATFTRNPSNPILRGVRIGSEIATKSLDAQVVHFIPRSESPPEQLGLVDEVIRNKPDAIVFAPSDPQAMVPAVDRLNAAGIPVTNVNERLAGGDTIAYVGTDDYQLALTTARYLINAMGKKGNIVILEGPDNLPTSIARVKAYKNVLKEFPDVKLLASKSANYARTPAAEVMKSFLRLYPQIDGVLAANDPMAIGAIEVPESRQQEGTGCRDQCQQGGDQFRQVGRTPRQRRLQRIQPRLPRHPNRDPQSAQAADAQGSDPQSDRDGQDQLPGLRDAGRAACLPDIGKRHCQLNRCYWMCALQCASRRRTPIAHVAA